MARTTWAQPGCSPRPLPNRASATTSSVARIPTRAINLARQLIAITGTVPSTQGRIKRGEQDCTIRLQPTPASRTYMCGWSISTGRRPRVIVSDRRWPSTPVRRSCPTSAQATNYACTTPASGTTTWCSPPPSFPGPPRWLIHSDPQDKSQTNDPRGRPPVLGDCPLTCTYVVAGAVLWFRTSRTGVSRHAGVMSQEIPG